MRLLIIVLILVLPFGWTNAQDLYSNQYYFGGGASLTAPVIANQNNYGFSELNYKFNMSHSAGAIAGIGIGYVHNIQMELLYTQQGQRYENTLTGELIEKNVKLRYIQIPLNYRYVFGIRNQGYYHMEQAKFYALVGIQFGLLQSASMQHYRNGKEETFEEAHITNSKVSVGPETTRDLFQPLDFGLSGGFGLQHFLSEHLLLMVEARGFLGVVDINNKDWRIENQRDIYEASRNALVGLRLGLVYMVNESRY